MEHEGRLEVSSRPSSRNHTLPFELLGEIFSHISQDSLDLRYPIFVCRSWHNAVVHHAHLWTNIVIGRNFLIRFHGALLRHGDAFVRLCISRSSPCPLRISVHDSDCHSLYDSSFESDSNDYFTLVKHVLDSNSGELGNLFQRCRSLSWVFVNGLSDVNGFSDVDFATRIFTSASFPALEYLTINNMFVPDGHPGTGSPRLPQLKEVTLIEHSESGTPPFFHDDDFAKAERLTFCVMSQWMDFDVNCIRRFRGIRILTLKGEGLYDKYVRTLRDPLKPVELSLLDTLTLYGRVPHGLLNPIRTPGLRKMEIEADNTKGFHSLVASQLVHLVRSLERLYVSISQVIRATPWVEELERVIAEAPSLVCVCVRPWMVQYLIGKEWCTTKLQVMDSK